MNKPREPHEIVPQIPTVREFRSSMDLKEQANFNDICAAFRSGMMKGRLVIQYCGKCLKWRLSYVPQARLDEILKERADRPYFVPEPDTFACMKCGRKLILNIDGDHTVLETKS